MNIQANFDLEFHNQFATLFDESSQTENAQNLIQQRADTLNTALVAVSEKVLGKRPKSKQPNWVSSSTLQLIAEEEVAKDDFKRKQTREKRDQWRNKQSSVKTAFKTDKEAYFNTQLEALELANQKHEYRTMWTLIDKISEKPQNAATSKVRMLDGSQPNSKTELISDWGKYFCKLLNNKSVKVETVNFPEPSPDIAISTASPMREDVVRAIEQLKRNKSPGPDYAMTAEVLKDGGKFIVNELHKLCELVFKHCSAPKQWTSSLIIPLPKKGNPQLMNNFRGISLMSIAAKTYNRILLNRIQNPIDKLLRNN